MSSLSAETKEVWAVIRHDESGASYELAEYIFEDDAVARAREEVEKYVTRSNCYCWCTIEHRIMPIYI